MSTIVSTEAVVLRSIKYGETSKIVTFYTKESGRISAIVKGARQSKSKYGSALEPMSYVSLVFYQKDSREVQTVSSCDRVKTFRYLIEDIEKMAIGLHIVEVINNVAHEQEKNIALFTLLVNSLTALDDATKNTRNLLYSFELKLAGVLGFHPTFNQCIRCEKDVFESTDEQFIEFHLDKGGPLCQVHQQLSGHKQKLSRRVLKILGQLSSAKDFDEVAELHIDVNLHEQIYDCLWSYLQYHVTGIRPLKSRRVFSKLLGVV